MFVGKLNVLLVQILKKEWPHNWPSFIPDIVSASKASEVLCTNNMEILKLLRYYELAVWSFQATTIASS